MNRRAVIMEELGLAPLWVRRELLRDDEADTVPSLRPGTPGSAVEATTAGRHPRSSVARAAHQILAPVLAAANGRPAPEAAPKPEPQNDERAQAIAAMDWATLQDAVQNCTACDLCKSRTQAVFGIGNPQAALVVVGEAPGADEDRQGEPFVGVAGKLLDNMLAAIGEKRGERVFIANVLKCRPPGNRNPNPQEVARCAPFLHRQLELIAPRVLLASGRFAVNALLDSDDTLGALRGKVHQYRNVPVIVTYHPAYLLRNLPDKSRAWQDLLLLKTQLPQSNTEQPGISPET